MFAVQKTMLLFIIEQVLTCMVIMSEGLVLQPGNFLGPHIGDLNPHYTHDLEYMEAQYHHGPRLFLQDNHLGPQGLDARSVGSSPSDQFPVTFSGLDSSISPYWADLEGRTSNPAPDIRHEDFAFLPDVCDKLKDSCNVTSPYRTMSGHCNNKLYINHGAAGGPLPRILPPAYDAGLFRTKSVAGGLLPNPRYISLLAREVPQRRQTTNHNVLVMQMGQFVDHDMVHVFAVRDGPGKSKTCKDCSSWTDPACAPIPIPKEDPFLPWQNHFTGEHTCLPFTRSVAQSALDAFGRPSLEQINVNSAFLDLSTVYGSSDCRKDVLRSYIDGLLIEIRQLDHHHKGFPPLEDARKFEECRSTQGKCFLAGDDRSNEHMGILMIHLLYFREHNRLASKLKEINPHWDDERLYQEARRINIAQYQHMLYSEFLPALLGQKKTTDYRLLPEKKGYYKGYNDRVNPGVLNEFSTSAFRVGHSMIPEDFIVMNSYFLPKSSVPLLETFHNMSTAVLPGKCDGMIRGLQGTRLKPIDLKLVDLVVDRLFEKEGVPYSGQDLFARNIARGRDHGLASYTTYRSACGGGTTNTFSDLRSVMSKQAVNMLRDAYAHVQDIDLFVGGLAEDPVPGGLVGPTFACIIAYQFLNSRRGDRYWYENKSAGLTHNQLQSIRTTSLARLLCDNMDHSTEIICGGLSKYDAKVPIKSYFIPSKSNPLKLCKSLTRIDLRLWHESAHRDPLPCWYLGKLHPWGRYISISPCLSCLCQKDGTMKCEPNLSGCKYPEYDEHCELLCS